MFNVTPHQREALKINKSISLTANAGSGKTFVLAQRFLQIILKTETPLNKIAAITFTEKAAGELYKRISEELDKLSLNILEVDTKTHIEKIKKQLVSANISTIHSFCIDLLKEFPVEASLDANFTTLNQLKANELIDISLETTIKHLLKDSHKNSNIKILVRLLGAKERLVDELKRLIMKRKNVITLIDKIYSKPEVEVTEQYFKIFEKNLNIIFKDELEELIIHLKKINDQVFQIDSSNELALEVNSTLNKIKNKNNLIDKLIELKTLGKDIITSNGDVRTRGYLKSGYRESLSNSIKIVEDFFSQLDKINLYEHHKIIEMELAKYTLALVNLFQDVYAEYENQKRELGVLDFEDILLKTRMLLQNESVKKSLSEKFNYLLIDEYQDTNEIQYEIFLPLLDDLKRGNLFIVGDEKQSIYRFRDAELQVFSKTKNDISSIYGEESLLTLPDSFRMAPAICLSVNLLFKNLFSHSKKYFNEVSASNLVCARIDEFPGNIEIILADQEKEDEAELVAKRILKLKTEFNNRFNNWNDIAVLVRKRDSFTELQKAFIKYHIPFNIVGGTGFYQKQSISDVYNYFAFLLNERDDAALIGVLRSPFFVVSDVMILELSGHNGKYYWEKLKQAALSNPNYWLKIFETLNINKETASRMSMSFLLREMFSKSNYIAVMSSRINADQELSNIYKLISITNDYFDDEFRTLFDYVTFLKSSINSTIDEAQGSIEVESKGVNILTIHQAKGLEFPAVFLFGCSQTSRLNLVKSKSFTVDKDFGILTKIPLKENFFEEYESAPIIGLYNLVEERKELAELKRLFYVGLTRAEDFICISQTGDGSKTNKNSFSSLLVEGLNLDLSKDDIVIKGDLDFLINNKDKFENVVKHTETVIQINRNIEISDSTFEYDITESITNKNLNLSEYKDHSKEEVISATRFSAFSNCPMKYNLLYNYKIGNLIELSRKYRKSSRFKSEEDYNRSEMDSLLLDDKYSTNEYSRLKGKIIHYILKKNLSKDSITEFVKNRLEKSSTEGIPESTKEDIIKDLFKFYDSTEYKFLNSFPSYKNEYEVYLKKEDFFLFGIIDRIIFDKKCAIIIDYKTDDVGENEINTRAGKYLPQLKFYAYIVRRLLNYRYEIEGKIIFIKHPDHPIVFKYDNIFDDTINSGLQSMISSIRKNNYAVNSDACEDCIFGNEKQRCVDIESDIK